MSYVRETGETYVAVELRRGGSLSVSTPVPFLTHMVETFLLYSGLGGVVEARVKRDLDGLWIIVLILFLSILYLRCVP